MRASARGWPSRAPLAGERGLSLLPNSLALIAAKVAAMGLGFVFWVLAARLFLPGEVGLAAAVVSAMMLCTQLASLGVGSALISHYPEYADDPWRLLGAALALVAGAAAACSAVFVAFAAGAFGELDVLASGVGYALLFGAATVFGTVWILLDQISTALRRGDQALVRGALFGACCVGALAAVAVLTSAGAWELIFGPWVVSGVVVCGVGILQLRRALPDARMRAGFERPLAGRLVRLGLPNWALTLAERAPGLMLPVVVTELLSPRANAVWYAAWMMAWVVYFVPIQVGLTLFAELVADPAARRQSIRRALHISLAIGLAAAVAVAIAAELALSVLGAGYAADGTAPLRILVLAVVPLTLVQVYFAACRAGRKLAHANVAGWLGGVLAVAAAALAGSAHGLTGMAVAWVASQCALGLWAALALRRLDAEQPRRLPGLRAAIPERTPESAPS